MGRNTAAKKIIVWAVPLLVLIIFFMVGLAQEKRDLVVTDDIRVVNADEMQRIIDQQKSEIEKLKEEFKALDTRVRTLEVWQSEQ